LEATTTKEVEPDQRETQPSKEKKHTSNEPERVEEGQEQKQKQKITGGEQGRGKEGVTSDMSDHDLECTHTVIVMGLLRRLFRLTKEA
jgi:hypothetical protein